MEDTITVIPPYTTGKGYIILPLQQFIIPPSLTIGNKEFFAKEEFHVSILSLKKYAPLISKKKQISDTDGVNILVNLFNESVEQSPITFISFQDEIRIAKEADNMSIIIMCAMQGIDTLFHAIQESLEIDIPIQPTHVTLYTLANGKGIGLNNAEEISQLSVQLTGEELQIFKQSIPKIMQES